MRIALEMSQISLHLGSFNLSAIGFAKIRSHKCRHRGEECPDSVASSSFVLKRSELTAQVCAQRKVSEVAQSETLDRKGRFHQVKYQVSDGILVNSKP